METNNKTLFTLKENNNIKELRNGSSVSIFNPSNKYELCNINGITLRDLTPGGPLTYQILFVSGDDIILGFEHKGNLIMVEHLRYNKEKNKLDSVHYINSSDLYVIVPNKDIRVIVIGTLDENYESKRAMLYSVEEGKFISLAFKSLDETNSDKNTYLQFYDVVESTKRDEDQNRLSSGLIGFIRLSDGTIHKSLFNELTNQIEQITDKPQVTKEDYETYKDLVSSLLDKKMDEIVHSKEVHNEIVKKLEKSAEESFKKETTK